MRTGDGTADHLNSTADFDGGLDRGFELRAPRGQPHDGAPCTCFAMNPRTSPLRTALAGLCGPSGQRDRPSADGLLAVAGLQLQAYDPPASFADPRLDALCREAARRGLVITDVQGRLVGDLRAVSVNEVMPAFRGC